VMVIVMMILIVMVIEMAIAIEHFSTSYRGPSRLSVRRVLLHCGYTFVTLFLHCCHTVLTFEHKLPRTIENIYESCTRKICDQASAAVFNTQVGGL
jgi:uncharacterized membrane protein YesL